MGITEAIKRARRGFGSSSVLMKIIWVNIGVFVALRLTAIVCLFAGNNVALGTILSAVELPSWPGAFAHRPWTIITYMFSQYDVFHILFNMIWLYWFGTLFAMSAGQRGILPLYLYGGIAGALLFMLVSNIIPALPYHHGSLIGSSAAVMAIVTATAIMMPDFEMHLLLLGAVKLKWIAIVTIGLVLLGMAGSNAGGEVAHLGGIAIGVVYAMARRRGTDITLPCARLLDILATLPRTIGDRLKRTRAPRPQPGTPHTAPHSGHSMSASDREELDAILEKIKRSGYSALTPDERKRLFDVSRRIK